MKRGCTQCGECLNVCPVYKQFAREEYSPKGKRLLMEPLDKDFGTPAAADVLAWDKIRDLARLCAGCGRCQTACARKLSTADLLAQARADHPHWTQQFWDIWIKNMGPAWPSLGLLASLVPGAVVPGVLRPMLDTAKSLVDKGNVRPWFRLKKDPTVAIDDTPVVLFSGCTATNVRRKWVEKSASLLTTWGYTQLDGSGFGCCGGTMHHAGRFDTQHAMESQNIAHWRALNKPRIVVFCASCHHSLAAYGANALQGDEAKQWLACLTPISKLLHGAVPEYSGAAPQNYGYHQPCHWGADTDMPFLQALAKGMHKGTALCCGMGGILQMSNAPLSRKMADTCIAGFPPKVQHILTGCSGCVMQLNAAAPKDVTVSHWLDVVL